MSHLSPERLAALSDDTPTPIEAAHITTCDACSAELMAQRKLSRLAAAAQVVVGPPISDFSALLPRLRAEGIAAMRDRRALVRRWAVRVAAALALVTGGVVGGRLTASHELPLLPTAQGGASGGIAAQPASNFSTPDDAMKALTVAQQNYQNAAAFLAAQDTSAHFIGLNQDTYRTRLEALDQIAAATRVALYQAPQDPVLNQYYLGTLTARDATLSQLRQAMPAARKLGELLTMDRNQKTGPSALRRIVRTAFVFGAMPFASAGAQAGMRERLPKADTTRDSTVARVVLNTDALERMIRELLASRQMEQTVGYALREAATGEKTDSRRMRELGDSLGRIARRNAGLITSIQMRCANGAMPVAEGYLGLVFDQTQISHSDSEPMMYKLGAVESVEPGSPAEKAGIRRGDVLLSIAGVDARRPIALGPILKPGKRVQVRLQRAQAQKDVSVVVAKRPAEYASDCATVEQMIGPEREAPVIFMKSPSSMGPPRAMVPVTPPDLPMQPGGFGYSFTMGSIIAGAQLMALDDDWRQSLGVDNGILVMKVAAGSPARDAGLRGNDVIISADDEAVNSVRTLQRIISSAKSNAVKLQVVRAGKTQAVTLRWQDRER